MSFSAMKEWICDSLCPCRTSSLYEFFRSSYKAISDAFYYYIDKHSSEINLADQDHTLQEITTISATEPPTSPCSDNNNAITDYFDIWIDKTSSNVFSQTSRKKLYQKGSFSNWYDVFGYVTFWWTEVIKRLCCSACNIYEKMQLSPESCSGVLNKEKPQILENAIEKTMETELPNNENFFHLLLLYCIIGGACLIIFLLSCKRLKTKPQNGDVPTLLDIKEMENKIVQKLITFLKKNKSIDANLKNEFFRFTDTMEGLENTRGNKIKFDVENLIKQEIAERKQNEQHKFLRDSEQISKVEKQCKLYQNQIRVLEQQLHDLLKNHRIEVKNYFAENKKIQLELGKTQKRLNLTHELHKTETEHLHQYIARLQAQYEDVKEFKTQQCQQDAQNEIKPTELVCTKPKPNSTGVVNKPPPVIIAQLKAQFGNKMHFNTQHLTNKQDTHNQLKSTEEVAIKQQRHLTGGLPKPSELQTQHKNTKEFDTEHLMYQNSFQDILQAREEVCVKPQRKLSADLNTASLETSHKNIKCKKTSEQPEIIDQEDCYIVETLKKIGAVLENAKELQKQVKEFSGNKNDETYLNLEEALIENAIQLNNVKCESPLLRIKSKNVWKYINKCRDMLESKIKK